MSTTHLHDADRTTGTCDCMAFLDIHYVAKTCNIIDSIDPCNLFHQLLVILQIKINRSNVGQRDFMQTKKQKNKKRFAVLIFIIVLVLRDVAFLSKDIFCCCYLCRK